MNIERTRKMTINNALAQIHILKQQAEIMSAQDSEPSAFRDIASALTKGLITPEEAIRQAQAVLDGKQDYH